MDWTPAIVVVSTGLLASILTLVISRYYQSKRELEIAHRDKKIELYDEFLKKLYDLFSEANKGKINPEELYRYSIQDINKIIQNSENKQNYIISISSDCVYVKQKHNLQQLKSIELIKTFSNKLKEPAYTLYKISEK